MLKAKNHTLNVFKTLDSSAPEHNARNEDMSARKCNSRFSNRDGDKEAKLRTAALSVCFIAFDRFLIAIYQSRFSVISA